MGSNGKRGTGQERSGGGGRVPNSEGAGLLVSAAQAWFGQTKATCGHLSAVALTAGVLVAQHGQGLMVETIAPNLQGVISDHGKVIRELPLW